MRAALHLDMRFRPSFKHPTPDGFTVQRIDYPSGCEPHVRVLPIDPTKKFNDITITTRIKKIEDLFILAMVVDSLWEQYYPHANIRAFIPYIPHARQDRVAVPGDALSMRVVAKMINAMDLSTLAAFDVHNENAFFNELDSPLLTIDTEDFVAAAMDHEKNVVMMFVAPDKGAANRYIPGFGWHVICDKVRDPDTGRIQSVTTQVQGDYSITGQTCMIIDDICDGGGTFIPIAKSLKEQGAKRVVLYVSHGLFTKGVDILIEGGIDHIYTTNSFADRGKYDASKVTVMENWNLL
jgi:ribose-phosphate pyrophosphokinase